MKVLQILQDMLLDLRSQSTFDFRTLLLFSAKRPAHASTEEIGKEKPRPRKHLTASHLSTCFQAIIDHHVFLKKCLTLSHASCFSVFLKMITDQHSLFKNPLSHYISVLYVATRLLGQSIIRPQEKKKGKRKKDMSSLYYLPSETWPGQQHLCYHHLICYAVLQAPDLRERTINYTAWERERIISYSK